HPRFALSVRRSALVERRYSSFPLGSAQLGLGRIHLALRLLAQQNGPELVALIITGNKLFLRVGPLTPDTHRQHTEIPDKIHAQIEHLRPKVRDLLVTDPLFASHVRARDQAFATGVFPLRPTTHVPHDPIPIRREIAHGINSYFFRLEILGDLHTV